MIFTFILATSACWSELGPCSPFYINESFSSKESLKLLLIQGQMRLIVSSDTFVVDFLNFHPLCGDKLKHSSDIISGQVTCEDDLYLVFIGLELISRNVS